MRFVALSILLAVIAACGGGGKTSEVQHFKDRSGDIRTLQMTAGDPVKKHDFLTYCRWGKCKEKDGNLVVTPPANISKGEDGCFVVGPYLSFHGDILAASITFRVMPADPKVPPDGRRGWVDLEARLTANKGKTVLAEKKKTYRPYTDFKTWNFETPAKAAHWKDLEIVLCAVRGNLPKNTTFDVKNSKIRYQPTKPKNDVGPTTSADTTGPGRLACNESKGQIENCRLDKKKVMLGESFDFETSAKVTYTFSCRPYASYGYEKKYMETSLRIVSDSGDTKKLKTPVKDEVIPDMKMSKELWLEHDPNYQGNPIHNEQFVKDDDYPCKLNVKVSQVPSAETVLIWTGKVQLLDAQIKFNLKNYETIERVKRYMMDNVASPERDAYLQNAAQNLRNEVAALDAQVGGSVEEKERLRMQLTKAVESIESVINGASEVGVLDADLAAAEESLKMQVKAAEAWLAKFGHWRGEVSEHLQEFITSLEQSIAGAKR